MRTDIPPYRPSANTGLLLACKGNHLFLNHINFAKEIACRFLKNEMEGQNNFQENMNTLKP
ncbi:hypothetical protein HMPREF9419_2062 [Prevotella nigrescens ATCC 33563]|nr:hypothetical protein HMPREF9419_2062 [Prevotella nigrescens ATCC 33563]